MLIIYKIFIIIKFIFPVTIIYILLFKLNLVFINKIREFLKAGIYVSLKKVLLKCKKFIYVSLIIAVIVFNVIIAARVLIVLINIFTK